MLVVHPSFAKGAQGSACSTLFASESPGRQEVYNQGIETSRREPHASLFLYGLLVEKSLGSSPHQTHT